MKFKLLLLSGIIIIGFIFWSVPNLNKEEKISKTKDVLIGHNESFTLTASSVKKEINGQMVDMYAYNGSIPGPIIKVKQNSTINLEFVNDLPEETLLHSHGVRMENEFDGTALVQKPIQPGEKFVYKLKFPDPGVYWYHPHVREDRQQEMGLYGFFIVEPSDPSYWSKVDREIPIVLDDLLLYQQGLVFGNIADRVMMGRYGNTMFVNGETDYKVEMKRNEIVRLHLLNAANVRPFRISIPGAKMKLVGGDSGAYEKEEYINELIISPSERYSVDVTFDKPGNYSLRNRGAFDPVELGVITVVDSNNRTHDFSLKTSPDLSDEFETFIGLPTTSDKNLNLDIEMKMMMGGMNHGMMEGQCHIMGDGTLMGDCSDDGIEWEDTMNMMNIMTNKNNVEWKIIDNESGFENEDIDWKFSIGDKVKVTLFNDPKSDHPMQHPIHFHGQRFFILSTNDVENTNRVWKDTVLVPVGDKIEILLDITNPGKWMAHCHISEHLEGGMMINYEVI